VGVPKALSREQLEALADELRSMLDRIKAGDLEATSALCLWVPKMASVGI
jgi:hypothetical protein